MVEAPLPVASSMRFAARPVGAAKAMERFRRSMASTMARRVVVFPVPGPPVMTRRWESTARMRASFCFSAKVMSSFSHTALTMSSAMCSARSTLPRFLISRATSCSARK